MQKNKKILYWIRQDFRIFDNPALHYAAQNGTMIPIYILDDINAGDYKMGGASRVWLYHSLVDIQKSFDGALYVFKGNPLDILKQITKHHDIDEICWNRAYEPWRIQRDKYIKGYFDEHNIDGKNVNVHSFNGSLLWEPFEVLKNDGTPYKVFTPFYRKGCLAKDAPQKPIPKPKSMNSAQGLDMGMIDGHRTIDELGLLPDIDWHTEMANHWEISESGAQKRLEGFIDDEISGYKDGRNFPSKKHVSRLSPYLHFGQISPNHVWHHAQSSIQNGADHTALMNDVDHFLSELGWREFSHNLLYFFPELPRQNLQKKFDVFPWRDIQQDENAQKDLIAWQKGMTGYPIVDAGMRELWQTGYMHNRVRMIVGSFLVKNLLLHWHHGEKWFWDCLFDADLANNSASWQWIAGCGADAAPYFRIFNPITQGQKFDPDGSYTRHYIPELSSMPDHYLFNPWEAPPLILSSANIILGKDYPKPIVDIKASRERALEAFSSLKNKKNA